MSQHLSHQNDILSDLVPADRQTLGTGGRKDQLPGFPAFGFSSSRTLPKGRTHLQAFVPVSLPVPVHPLRGSLIQPRLTL